MNLTKEQIENWRRVIAMQGFGIIARFLPDESIIAYAKKMKSLIENSPEVKEAKKPKLVKKKCPPHGNVITGQNGKYCIDCERYI